MRLGTLLIFVGLLAAGCNEKSKIVDPSTLPKATGQVVGDTNYIQMQPVWSGFSNPRGVKIGYDFILYVVETDSNRIQMVDLAGNRLGHSQYVKHPTAVTEDRRFNLIVTCEYDTSIGGNTVSLAAIAKIRLFNFNHDIAAATVDIVSHESPQNRIVRDGTGRVLSGRVYTGVAVLPDNSYYVTRSGNQNSSPVDPDNFILHFDKNDNEYSSGYIDLVPNLTATGTGFVAINQLSSIATFPTKQSRSDFVVTQVDPQSAYKVKWFTYDPGSELRAPEWLSKLSLDPAKYTNQKLPDILNNIFVSPLGVMIDDRSNIFVVDSQLDSVMKFDQNGRLLPESFGKFKTGNALLEPAGITYFNKTLYIADAGHNRILRYRLSTDFR